MAPWGEMPGHVSARAILAAEYSGQPGRAALIPPPPTTGARPAAAPLAWPQGTPSAARTQRGVAAIRRRKRGGSPAMVPLRVGTPGSCPPDLQPAMPGGVGEVLIGGQERQVVADAELGDQGIDGSDLHTGAAACRAERRGVDMVLSIGLHQRQRGEAVDDLCPRLGPGKPLSNSWKMRPVIMTVCAPSRACSRCHTSVRSATTSRRSANDQTLVSTKSIMRDACVPPCDRTPNPIRAYRATPPRGAARAGR